METIVSQFEHYVKTSPDAIAVVFGDKVWTYGELNNYANYLSSLLIAAGVKKSSVIAVMGEKSFEMVAGILAILKLNCSYMPVDSSLPPERIQLMLSNADTKHIITNKPLDASIIANDQHCLVLNHAEFNHQTIYNNLNFTISADDLAYVMHTSGSTGVPKGVLVPHRGVIRLLKNTNYIQIHETDRILFHSNTSFDAGIFEIWAALINGARLVISPFMVGDIPSIFKLCKQQKITILLLATGLFHIFSNLDLEELEQLRYLVVGGDVMHSSAAIRAIQKQSKMKIINGYGPAENTVFTTCLIINDVADVTNPVSIGKAITNTEVYLLDENKNEVAEGEIGELYTSGLGVALGYINDVQLSREKFIHVSHLANNKLLYRTGDLARKLPSGDYEFIGRRDKQVKIRGFRVELTEIENAISGLSFVEDVCVTTTPGENKQLIAFIKLGEDNHQPEEHNPLTISTYLKTKLPSYCIPSAIHLSHSFPLTTNGKIDRKALDQQLQLKQQTLIKEGI